MPRLGELNVEQLLDGADRDMAYLVERLDKLARERGDDPEHIEEIITRATTTQVRSQLIVAQGKWREERKALQAAAAPAGTTSPGPDHDPERSERQAAEAMTAHLVALGVAAETVNTGGNCWATSITLTPHTRLELADAPGELWAWCLYHHGGDQVLCGHWDSANDHTVASKAQALIHAMGSIVA
ncbi:hypothetical protein [Streptomyces sp. NPDC026673]|uniref:hypothetical protein n=1 Tax=Streptomyces sp. NPDC026673 TaxID=3155724 RepID=UPI0034069D1F